MSPRQSAKQVVILGGRRVSFCDRVRQKTRRTLYGFRFSQPSRYCVARACSPFLGGLRRLRRKKALWRPAGRQELESFALVPWASRRRQDLLELLHQLTPKIVELTRALEAEVEKRPVTRRLMTHPGVGPLTALVFELVDWNSRTLPLRQADRQLCGSGTVRGIQRRSATAWTHQQAGQRPASVSPGEAADVFQFLDQCTPDNR